jgi:hypothetical protein
VITLADVCDAKPSAMLSEDGVAFDVDNDEESAMARPSSRGSADEYKSQGSDIGKEDDRSRALSDQPADRADYRATDDSPEGIVGPGWSFNTPMPSDPDQNASYFENKPGSGTHGESETSTPGASRPRSLSRPRRAHIRSRSRSSVYVEQNLPRPFARPIAAWLDRVAMLFAPQWRLTTILVWCAWWGMSLGKFLHNVHMRPLTYCANISVHYVQCVLAKTT